jgi:ubiquinone/menaquinone biosynthesis C-methylase UbiE
LNVNPDVVKADFDEIARLSDDGSSGTDQYTPFLTSLVPREARHVLDVGCGLGHLTVALAEADRDVIGIDLSPEMIDRARRRIPTAGRVSFVRGDFLRYDFGTQQFDCVISAAALHHMCEEVALRRMVGLLRARGRLVIHDLRRNTGIADTIRSYAACAPVVVERLVRTGRPRSPGPLRKAWARHGAGERYLSLNEARTLTGRLLPGARLFNHWLWRYTIVWDKAGPE